MSTSEVLTFSSDVVETLPLYYRALAQHLATTGRAIIEDPSEKAEKKQP
jgi:uncharacterized membrane-anchored protein YhcB (DUF1043 family)